MCLTSKLLVPVLFVQLTALPVFASDSSPEKSQAELQNFFRSPQAAETIGLALRKENFTPIGADGKPASIQSIFNEKNVRNGMTIAFRAQSDSSREYAIQMKPMQKSDGSPALSLKLLRHASDRSWVLVSNAARTSLSMQPGRDAAAISLDAARAMNVLEAQIVADLGGSPAGAHSWLAKISSFLVPEAQASGGTNIARVVSYTLLAVGGLMAAAGAYGSRHFSLDVPGFVEGFGSGCMEVLGCIIFAIGGGLLLITYGINAAQSAAGTRHPSH